LRTTAVDVGEMFNYHNILLSSQNDQTGSAVVWPFKKK